MKDLPTADPVNPRTAVAPVATMSFNQTKFLPPVSIRGGVLRERLLMSLEEQTHARVVVLLAPAGYGKTTLMGQWMTRLRQAGGHVSWLTLDESDNDPMRLVHYLYGALREWLDVVSGSSEAGMPVLTDWMSLLDYVNPSAVPLTLFIDEFETLTDPAALGMAKLFVSRLPPSVRLVIGSRERPALVLERYRVREELIELTVNDLRFVPEETRSFLSSRFQWLLSGWLIDKVQMMTDGWPAALQLTALATRSLEELEWYAHDLSGSLINIADYLAEDVLQAQTAEVREFLLETCYLPRLSAAVCDATTGRSDSKHMLLYLERHGLFINALDVNHIWYRYHPLFAEFLQNQQAGQLPRDRCVEIFRSAALWFSRHATAMEAVDLWLLAGDTEAAIKEMTSCAQELVIQGQFGTILRWIRRLDAETINAAGPKLALAAAWAYGFAGELDIAMQWVAELKPKLAASAEHDELADELVALETVLLGRHGNTREALQIGLQHWPHVNAAHYFAAGALANAISYCLQQEAEFERASEFSLHARVCNEKIGSAFGLGYALVIYGSIKAIQGHLDLALEMYSQIDAMASMKLRQPWFETTHVKEVSIGLIATILYEQDRLDEAEELLQRYLPLLARQSSIDMKMVNQVVRIRIRVAQDDLSGALEILEQTFHAASASRFARVRSFLNWERVRIDLVAGRTTEALALAEMFATVVEVETDPDQSRMIFVEEIYGLGIEPIRCMIARGEAGQALVQLDEQIVRAKEGNRRWRLLKLKLLRVLALDAMGEKRKAQDELVQALCLGQSINVRRSFTDQGQRLVALLAELPPQALTALPDAEAVIRFWRDLCGQATPQSLTGPDSKVVALSEREHSILSLMMTGQGNEQIATQLFLSVNTVKWYVRRILEKLDARNRNEAVFIARQLSLV